VRILIASSYRGMIGGAESYQKGLLPALRARGHAVGLFTQHGATDPRATIDGDDGAIARWCVEEQGEQAALSGVRDWRPDVVFSQGVQSPELEEELATRFPAVMFAHNYYGTCISGNKCHAFPAVHACERIFGPMCLLLYHARRCGGLNPATAWRQYRLQAARQRLLRCFRAVLVASAHVREEYLRHGVEARNLHLVPYLLTTGMAPDGEPPTDRPLGGRVLLLGRLTRIKGGEHLVRALPQAEYALGRPLSLVVAGDGPERPRLQALARRLGVRAEFVGWVGGAERSRLLRQADVLAVPSLWPEPFGLVGIEAGCVGLPAVGYATGGIRDWLLPGESGELAPGDRPTVAGLAEALVRALGDPAHYNRLRRGAWRVAQRYTVARHVDLLLPILERAAGGLG
jgi:glycosyltransferase involved in cell wall biosynthesis